MCVSAKNKRKVIDLLLRLLEFLMDYFLFRYFLFIFLADQIIKKIIQ